jgi:hypothetical protein
VGPPVNRGCKEYALPRELSDLGSELQIGVVDPQGTTLGSVIDDLEAPAASLVQETSERVIEGSLGPVQRMPLKDTLEPFHPVWLRSTGVGRPG